MDLSEFAANKPGISHEMCTKSRGRVLATTRGTLIGKHGDQKRTNGPVGLNAANIYEEPDHFTTGSNAEVGLTDADNWCCDYEEE